MTKRALLMAGASLAFAAPAMAGGPGYPAYTPDLVPPSSNPGECYARVQVPAQYETVNETVITKEAHTKMHVAQPQLRSRQEQVMVKEPSVRFKVRQPSYRSVSEQVLTRPSYEKLSVSPPSFQTVTETIQTSAPRLVWKKGNPGELARQGYTIHSTADSGYRGQGYASTQSYGALGGEKCGAMCEIWCLVEEPGETKSVTRQVMSNPGSVQRTRVPAVYQTVVKQVVADPGGVEEIPVPGEYRSITVQDIVSPGREALIEVPAEYGTVQTKRLIADERYEWRRVLCKPGTQGYSAPATSHSTTTYSAPSYTAPTYTAPSTAQGTTYSQPSYSSSTGSTGYVATDTATSYESGQVCRDPNCPDSYPAGGSYGTSHSGRYSGGSYSGESYSSSDAYEAGRASSRHWRKRSRR